MHINTGSIIFHTRAIAKIVEIRHAHSTCIKSES